MRDIKRRRVYLVTRSRRARRCAQTLVHRRRRSRRASSLHSALRRVLPLPLRSTMDNFKRLFPTEFYAKFIESDIRPDGRSLRKSRKITIGAGAPTASAPY